MTLGRPGQPDNESSWRNARFGFPIFVPDFLIGTAAMPSRMPDYYSPGGPDEAILYVLDNRENWAATEGALPWLARAIQDLPPPEEG